MSRPSVAFFNNKGGVGKTSLVYHLAWMYSDLGFSVLAADLDPQANLSAAFLDEERLEEFLEGSATSSTIFGSIQPLLRGTGDIEPPHVEEVSEKLNLLVGDLDLSRFEDELSNAWSSCVDRKERAFRVISAFWRVVQAAADRVNADVVLVDLGPNLGAINRAAMIATDFVAVPVSPDLFSLQGLRNLGPVLRDWRIEWKDRLGKRPGELDLELPGGEMRPIGYIVLQHAVRLDRPVKAYLKWIGRIPRTYRMEVLQEADPGDLNVQDDPHCLYMLKHYRSLMPLAQEAKKPIFHLKPADGALGAHLSAARSAENDFRELAVALSRAIGLDLPSSAERPLSASSG